jgi:hypothetical protein
MSRRRSTYTRRPRRRRYSSYQPRRRRRRSYSSYYRPQPRRPRPIWGGGYNNYYDYGYPSPYYYAPYGGWNLLNQSANANGSEGKKSPTKPDHPPPEPKGKKPLYIPPPPPPLN